MMHLLVRVVATLSLTTVEEQHCGKESCLCGGSSDDAAHSCASRKATVTVSIRCGGRFRLTYCGLAKPCRVVAVNTLLVNIVLLTDVLLEPVKEETIDPSAIQSCLETLRGVFELEQCKLMTL